MANVSPAPSTPQTGTKAYIGGAAAFLTAFITALLVVWTDTDPLQARDFVVATGSALGSGALVGILTYTVPNQPTGR
jgi:hypothetical protein